MFGVCCFLAVPGGDGGVYVRRSFLGECGLSGRAASSASGSSGLVLSSPPRLPGLLVTVRAESGCFLLFDVADPAAAGASFSAFPRFGRVGVPAGGCDASLFSPGLAVEGLPPSSSGLLSPAAG